MKTQIIDDASLIEIFLLRTIDGRTYDANKFSIKNIERKCGFGRRELRRLEMILEETVVTGRSLGYRDGKDLRFPRKASSVYDYFTTAGNGLI